MADTATPPVPKMEPTLGALSGQIAGSAKRQMQLMVIAILAVIGVGMLMVRAINGLKANQATPLTAEQISAAVPAPQAVVAPTAAEIAAVTAKVLMSDVTDTNGSIVDPGLRTLFGTLNNSIQGLGSRIDTACDQDAMVARMRTLLEDVQHRAGPPVQGNQQPADATQGATIVPASAAATSADAADRVAKLVEAATALREAAEKEHAVGNELAEQERLTERERRKALQDALAQATRDSQDTVADIDRSRAESTAALASLNPGLVVETTPTPEVPATVNVTVHETVTTPTPTAPTTPTPTAPPTPRPAPAPVIPELVTPVIPE